MEDHGHPRGAPIVLNGLALRTLHHAAFDRHVLGVRPDLKVEIRLDVLEVEDEGVVGRETGLPYILA